MDGEGQAHIARHGVTPGEVEEAVCGRPQWVVPRADSVTLRYARTENGRYLSVVLAEAMDGRDYVVTARDMTQGERRSFGRNGRQLIMARLGDIANYYGEHDTSTEMGEGHWEAGRAESDPMVTTSLRLPKSVLDRVRERAAAENMKATAWMRAVVEEKVEASGESTEARLRRLESVVFSKSA